MKRVFKRFRTVISLEDEDKLLMRQVFFLLFYIRMQMFFFSFSKVLAWVRKKTPIVEDIQISNPKRVAWMIESTGKAIPRFLKCLPKALAGFILLRRCGWDVTLQIGARRLHPDLPIEAHAWLEYKDEIIIGKIAGMEKYAIFESLQGQYI